MPRQPETLSIRSLAKLGDFEGLRRRLAAGDEADLASIFHSAVTDFRTVKRNPGHLQILKWTVDAGLDLDARAGWSNQSMICLAAAAGNNEIVRYMLERQPTGSPFAWASLGEVELLSSHADRQDLAELRDENGFNLLFHCAQSALGRGDAAVRERLTAVCRLLLRLGVSAPEEVQLATYPLPVFPAFLCAYGGNVEIMRLLLQSGGLSEARFHQVVEHALEPHGRSGEPFFEIADCIVQHGFDIDQLRADQGRTLLHGAANRGSIKAVKWLLANGANPNTLDTDGRTPLHVCAERNTSAGVARLLVEAGAQPDAKDGSGQTALDYARQKGRGKIVEYLESILG